MKLGARTGTAVLVLAAIGLLGCSSGESTAPGATCEANPEGASAGAGVHPTRLAVNGQNLNGASLNAGYLNGVRLNAGYMNGGYLNSGYMNGVRLNGVKLNGIQANGLQVNGLHLNGIQSNGVQNNGIQSNGVQNNGVQNNGATPAANELVGFGSDGAIRAGDAVIGGTLTGVLSDGQEIALVVSSFERSEDRAIAYYALTLNGENVCGEGGKGMFLPGVWDDTASRHDEMQVGGSKVTTSYSCTTGVLAKCVGWGYAPWNVGADLHQTCTRMGRADYCGTGVSFTKDGTPIDVFDTRGIQSPTGDPTYQFEAAWGPSGAVCVNRTRYEAHTVEGSAVLPSCWAALPRCSSLEEAGSFGAILGNASRPASRTFCSGALAP